MSLAMFAAADQARTARAAWSTMPACVGREPAATTMIVDRLGARCSRSTSSAAFLCAREAVKRMSTRHGGQGRRHRQPVLEPRPQLGASGRVRRLRRREGRDRRVHPRPGARGRGRGHPRQRASRPGIIDTDIHASGRHAGPRGGVCAHQIPMKREGSEGEDRRCRRLAASPTRPPMSQARLDVTGGR